MPERRRRPRRASTSLVHLLGAIEALPDALLVSGRDGRIVAANRAAEELFGYGAAELTGQPIEMLLPERLRGAHTAHRQDYYAHATRRTMSSRYDLMALRRDGSEFQVDISLNQVTTPDGDFVLSGVRDLSVRLRTEELLRASERNFRELFEGANDVVYTHDFEGKFTAVNPAGLRIYGYTEEEITRLNIAQVVDPAYLEVARSEVIRKLHGAERSEPYELLTHAKGGSDVWVEVSTRLIMEGDRPTGVQGIARDVTDRKRAEKALRETEERLTTFVSNAPVVLFATNLDGVFTMCEGRALSDLNVRPGDVVGRSFHEILVGVPRMLENVQRALAGDAFTDSVVLDRGVHLEVHHAPIRDERGEVRGMRGIAIDTTARVQAEDALRVSERRLMTVASNVPIGLCALDKDGVFILCEGKVLESFGLRPGELVGRSAFDVYADWPDFVGLIRRALAGEEAGGLVEMAGLTFETSLTPVLDAAGAVSSVILLSMDVTERTAAERALRSATEFQDLVMQSTTDAIVAFDMEGRFTLVNRRACEMSGYTPEELIGQPYAIVIAEHRLAETAEALRDTLQHGLPVEAFETDLVRRDGSRAVIAFNLAPMVEHGKIVGAVCTAEDVTERRRSASLLAAQARLLETIAAGPPTLDALESIARLVEEHATDLRCTIRVKGGDGLSWRCHAAPSLPDDFLAVMDEAIAGPLGGPVRGGGEVVVPDVADDLQWAPARAWVTAHDIRSIWMTPVWSSGRSVIGILSIYSGRPGEPDEGQRELAGVATHLAGVVIERDRAERERRASEERYRQIFERNTAVKILIDPGTGRIVDANTAATEFYGYSFDELTSKTVLDLNQAPREAVMRALARAKTDEQSYFQFRHRTASGEIRDIEIYANPIEVNDRELVCSIIHDISDRKLTEHQLAAQRHLLELIAVGEPLETVLNMLVSTIEEQAPGALCSVLFVTPDGRLTNAAAPSLPDAYNAAVEGAVIGPSAGSCGTAAYRREPVIVADIATDPLWEDYRDAALPHGLRSCWSTPIFSSGGDVLGTFAVYYKEPRAPDAHHTALIRIGTHVAGIAIERQRAEEAARSRTEELERLYAELVRANAELAESKERLEEKSLLLERALEQEREQARRDPLTGTLSHAAITETLRDIISKRESAPVAVAMVDVDGLKAVNDTYGHQVGDAVLMLIAEALGRQGAIIGRYGGDEFVAILHGADRRVAEDYRDAVLASLSSVRVTDDPQNGTAVPVVASVGLAIFPEEAEAVDDLIRLSDSAMYASRRQRALDGDGRALSRSLGNDRAARMVGEIVPLLTSPGDLGNKLRLVSHRLSVGAGYDGVNFVIIDGANGTFGSSAFAYTMSERDHDVSNGHQRKTLNHELKRMLRISGRPIIIDDVSNDQRLTPEEHAMLENAGIRSALVAPMRWQDELIGVLSVGSKRAGALNARDAEFVAAVATQVTAIVRMASMLDELQASSGRLMRAHTETVLMLAGAAEAHDHTTGRHLQRVRGVTEVLARELGHTEEAARDLGLAAVLHDIGKIRVPDMVLGSSAKLAESEWVLMKQHTIWGSEFLGGQQGFELAAQVARSHHERWDGSGYPDGLAGDAIPESAQITSVADAFDAMTNDRPYRLGRPSAAAVAEIVACSGTQFSPRVVDALVRLYERGEMPLLEPNGVESEAEAA